jgi:hypothetical protein
MSKRSVPTQILIAFGVIFGGLAAIVGLIFVVHLVTGDGPGSPSRSLEGVAVSMTRDTGMLLVCARQDLHSCVLRVGTSSGRDYVWSPPTIRAVPSCDQQTDLAYSNCATEAGSMHWDRTCLESYGLFATAPEVRSDPRDPHLRDGQTDLQCIEGRHEGSFAAGPL